MNPVTLQINLAPRDFRYAQYLLPHQFKQWGGQVAEILLVIESYRSKGHFGENWEEGMKKILALAHSIPNARVISVDYSRKARRRVSAEFFGGARYLPKKDVRGGPYYAYFYGVSQAAHNLVLHTDSDMFFGGGSQSWLAEAVELFDEHPEVLVVNPNCSPPPSSGRIEDYHYEKIDGVRETRSGGISLVSEHITTRVFLMNKQKFFEKLGPLKVGQSWPHRNPIRNLIWLWRHCRRFPAELPEVTISKAMQLRGLVRLDYLGKAPGMWCLHPPDPLFPGYFESLPRLVHRIEAGDLPEGQRGYYNMNESMQVEVPA